MDESRILPSLHSPSFCLTIPRKTLQNEKRLTTGFCSYAAHCAIGKSSLATKIEQISPQVFSRVTT